MKKKRLITLLLAVIMVMSLLPMSAFALGTNIAKKGTAAVLAGDQILAYEAKDATGSVATDYAMLNLTDAGLEVGWSEAVALIKDVNGSKAGANKGIIYVEPGTKLDITGGATVGAQLNADFYVNDGLNSSKSRELMHDEMSVGDNKLGEAVKKLLADYFTFDELELLKVHGAVPSTATIGGDRYDSNNIDPIYGRDFTKGWAKVFLGKGHRLINIPSTAQVGKVIKVKGQFETGRGYLYIVIADRKTVVDEVLTNGGYPVTVAVRQNGKIPYEPGSHTGGYTHMSSANKVGTDSTTYAGNGSGIINEDKFLEYYTASADGTNTGGVVDATGVKTKECLTLTNDDYVQMKLAYIDKGQGFAADGTPISTIKSQINNGTIESSAYQLIPYVVKLETGKTMEKGRGWHIDMVLVPTNRITYQYELNIPKGLSVLNIQAPGSGLQATKVAIEQGFSTTIYNPAYNYVDPENIANVNFIDPDSVMAKDRAGNDVKLRFVGWEDDNGKIWEAGDNAVLKAQNNAGNDIVGPIQENESASVTFKGVWEIVNTGLNVTKTVEGTNNVDDFNCTFNIKDASGEIDNTEYSYTTTDINGDVITTDGETLDTNYNGTIKSGGIFKLKNGYTVIISGLPVGYTYEIKENVPDSANYTPVEETISAEIQPAYDENGIVPNGIYYNNDKIENDFSNEKFSLTVQGDDNVSVVATDKTKEANDVTTSGRDAVTKEYLKSNGVTEIRIAPQQGFYADSVVITKNGEAFKTFSKTENADKLAELNNGESYIELKHDASYSVEVKSAQDTYNPNAFCVVDYAAKNASVKHDVTADMGYFYSNPQLTSQKFSYGTANLSGNEITYNLNRLLSGVDKITYNIQKNDSAKTVNSMTFSIIPANNVYYDDQFLSTTGNITFSGDWDEVKAGSYEANPEKDNNAHGGGWETVDTQYSDGGAMKTDAKGASAEFTFTGTAVDVYTKTTSTSGTVLVTLTKDGATKVSKVLVVNNESDSADYYQIPTVFFKNLTYGTYKVKIQTSGNGEYYIDGIRVYNPLSTNTQNRDAVVKEAYKDELNAEFISIREQLITTPVKSSDVGYEGTDDSIAGIAFIDKNGVEDAKLADKEAYAIADYTSYGPKNEVYLANGNGIAFNVGTTKDDNCYYIGLKAPNGTVTAQVSNGVTTKTYTITGATEQYYKVTPSEKGNIAVINNGSDGNILSVTNLRVTNPAPMADASKLCFAPAPKSDVLAYVNSMDDLETDQPDGSDVINPDDVDQTSDGGAGDNGGKHISPDSLAELIGMVRNLFSGLKSLFAKI